MELDLSQLNAAQRQAVEDTEGYVLVLAGAGSGKTRVLTHRVAYLIKEKGVESYRILAITFTNKAANEMKERLDRLLGEDNEVWISTFHSLCAAILRRHAKQLGYGDNFSIYDESDARRQIKKILREKRLDEAKLADVYLGYIGDAKSRGLTPDAYYADINGSIDDADLIREIYERYQELLTQANAMDFDDLLYKTKELFLRCPDVLEYYRNRFRYIHVDEFQDTNGVQYELVKLLSSKHGNLFVVGDDDQSIYSWRGAVVGNILHFDREFPEAKVYRLLQNYRSTSSILDTANRVIACNKERHPKELFTERGKGVRTEYFEAYSDYQEADWVVDNILSLKRFSGYTNKDFAILVRANSLTRLFETRLSQSRLDYRVLGGFRFFDRAEIQNVIAYMRMIANPRDTEAIERIINFPRRGIGDTTVEKLASYARNNGTDLIDVILDFALTREIAGGAAANKVAEFAAVFSDLLAAKEKPLKEFVEFLINRVDFRSAYATGKEEDETRFENIVEFVRQIGDFVKNNAGKATIDDFLQNVALMPERSDEIHDDDNVTVATMHAVKGLEFKVVFIVGCEEDIFPSSRTIAEGNLEEERRLMYVAVTRAQERLFISCAHKRYRFNRPTEMLPSRFIAESRGTPEKRDAYGVYESRKAYIEGRPSRSQAVFEPEAKPKRTFVSDTIVKPAPSKMVEKDMSGFVGGAKISHPKYGEGVIVLVQGEGANKSATVNFPGIGVKKFIIQLAPIKLI